MFEKLALADKEYLCILEPDGNLRDIPSHVPTLSNEEILSAYRLMLLARQADEWAVSLNRQGRMSTYPPNKGQEANAVGAVLALRKDDWLVPSFRELGAWIAKGIPLHQVYMYWYGNEQGSNLPLETYHTLPIAIPVGSQPLHAVGIAYAEKLKASDRIVLTFMGEGATSQGAVHEAFNLAGVWNVGVVFYVQNNQWAISLPTEKQTASRTLAEKACAYGFESIRVDGNDLLAVHAAASAGAKIAREERRPVLIEGYTYRLGAHTTADDPKLYREEAQVESWLEKDPLLRLEKYLMNRGLLDQTDREDLLAAALTEAKLAFERVESEPDPSLEETFRYTFATLPPILERQLQRRLEA
ncbi:MAG: pyruvate dehydrogenase (acetyl-transferring) E1 component subunit alpha [Spirochaetaceae bacterium]|nr:MAG: pyruvate dehydrogenase (acetyl-transferring) E1 component subunit alpha [Spirochaetaceae bacterium]